MNRDVTLSDKDKLRLLREHSIDGYWPDLNYRNWCLHCEKEFDGHAVRVCRDSQAELGLKCGTPGCSGSPLDWAPYPWWDEAHPLTRQRHEKSSPEGKPM